MFCSYSKKGPDATSAHPKAARRTEKKVRTNGYGLPISKPTDAATPPKPKDDGLIPPTLPDLVKQKTKPLKWSERMGEG